MQECIGDHIQVMYDEVQSPGDRGDVKDKQVSTSSSRNGRHEIGKIKMSISWMEWETENTDNGEGTE